MTAFRFSFSKMSYPSLFVTVADICLVARLDKPKDMRDLHSHAAECAFYYGVPPAVIERAKKVT